MLHLKLLCLLLFAQLITAIIGKPVVFSALTSKNISSTKPLVPANTTSARQSSISTCCENKNNITCPGKLACNGSNAFETKEALAWRNRNNRVNRKKTFGAGSKVKFTAKTTQFSHQLTRKTASFTTKQSQFTTNSRDIFSQPINRRTTQSMKSNTPIRIATNKLTTAEVINAFDYTKKGKERNKLLHQYDYVKRTTTTEQPSKPGKIPWPNGSALLDLNSKRKTTKRKKITESPFSTKRQTSALDQTSSNGINSWPTEIPRDSTTETWQVKTTNGYVYSPSTWRTTIKYFSTDYYSTGVSYTPRGTSSYSTYVDSTFTPRYTTLYFTSPATSRIPSTIESPTSIRETTRYYSTKTVNPTNEDKKTSWGNTNSRTTPMNSRSTGTATNEVISNPANTNSLSSESFPQYDSDTTSTLSSYDNTVIEFTTIPITLPTTEFPENGATQTSDTIFSSETTDQMIAFTSTPMTSQSTQFPDYGATDLTIAFTSTPMTVQSTQFPDYGATDLTIAFTSTPMTTQTTQFPDYGTTQVSDTFTTSSSETTDQKIEFTSQIPQSSGEGTTDTINTYTSSNLETNDGTKSTEDINVGDGEDGEEDSSSMPQKSITNPISSTTEISLSTLSATDSTVSTINNSDSKFTEDEDDSEDEDSNSDKSSPNEIVTSSSVMSPISGTTASNNPTATDIKTTTTVPKFTDNEDDMEDEDSNSDESSQTYKSSSIMSPISDTKTSNNPTATDIMITTTVPKFTDNEDDMEDEDSNSDESSQTDKSSSVMSPGTKTSINPTTTDIATTTTVPKFTDNEDDMEDEDSNSDESSQTDKSTSIMSPVTKTSNIPSSTESTATDNEGDMEVGDSNSDVSSPSKSSENSKTKSESESLTPLTATAIKNSQFTNPSITLKQSTTATGDEESTDEGLDGENDITNAAEKKPAPTQNIRTTAALTQEMSTQLATNKKNTYNKEIFSLYGIGDYMTYITKKNNISPELITTTDMKGSQEISKFYGVDSILSKNNNLHSTVNSIVKNTEPAEKTDTEPKEKTNTEEEGGELDTEESSKKEEIPGKTSSSPLATPSQSSKVPAVDEENGLGEGGDEPSDETSSSAVTTTKSGAAVTTKKVEDATEDLPDPDALLPGDDPNV